jgi:hypothetical protein
VPEEVKDWPFREGESWKTGSSLKKERMEAYIEWLITPRAERDPKQKQELAEQLGVTPATLRGYDKEPYVQREVLRRGRGLAKVNRAADVLDALYRRATDPESGSAGNSAAKIWLDWVDRATSQSDEVDLEDMDDEQLVEYMQRLLDQIEERSQ